MYKAFKIKIGIVKLFVLFVAFSNIRTLCAQELKLNGTWEIGSERHYTNETQVPGIAIDPTIINKGKLWYRKEIVLPSGNWKYATLELKGARFMPEVYINGILVSKQNGGMAPTYHRLIHDQVKPGNKIIIEIALDPLKDVSPTDASYIPLPDQWRSNVSSCLWDDVVLHCFKFCRIEEPVPFIDFDHKNVSIKYSLSKGDTSQKIVGKSIIEVLDMNGKILLRKKQSVFTIKNTVTFQYGNILKPWSPQNPALYQMRITLLNANGEVDDIHITSLGIKKFEVRNKQFYLNNEPCKIGGGTVVWHRWVRTSEGRELGYDTTWFYKNVVLRLKEHGANYLRFHLGKPPERLLDLCDRYGLLVQYEWSFFHGMPASAKSISEQYKAWLDVAMRHPCVSLIHPYNETEGDQLKIVWQVLNKLLVDYPSLVLEDRDVIHVHKYWWSLFENLGLYYDSYQQFDKAVMVDEFGGNYLDEKGDFGKYVTVKESYLRFLGCNQTATMRLAHQAMANGKVAEYWRRIGVAGVAPFCILGSSEDGNNWFMGSLKDGKEKPVWDALTAAWSPQSVSIELWDKNFIPKQPVLLPVYIFNDIDKQCRLKIRINISDTAGKVFVEKFINTDANPFSKTIKQLSLQMPQSPGIYNISAELLNRPINIKYPVISKWSIHVFRKTVPQNLVHIKVGVPDNEPELKSFLEQSGIIPTYVSDETATAIITSASSWDKIAKGDKTLLSVFENAIKKGRSVVMLDIGEKHLGQGYPENKNDLGPLQGVARIPDPKSVGFNLFSGIKVSFTEASEPESHIQADKNNNILWNNIPQEYTWLWNGMRGGLISPALDMEFTGLNPSSYLAQWKAHGADDNLIKGGNYYAYELQGFYEFSSTQNDEAIKKKLKEKIEFLVQDAPALAVSINPQTPIKTTDLSQGYKDAQNGLAENLVPLVNAGKNLTRTPVIMIDFGRGKGNLVASQLLTKGRLAKGFGGEGLYGIRYDEVAVQFVLNMMSLSIRKIR